MDPKLVEQFSRRGFVQRFGTAMAGVSLSGIFPGDKIFAAPASALADYTNPLKPRKAHFPTKAKACIYLYMYGGPSQMDLFDYKPELLKRHGQKWDPGETIELFQSSPGNTFKSPWEWSQHGQCSKPLTSIVSELGQCVDDITFIHNVVGKTGVHS